MSRYHILVILIFVSSFLQSNGQIFDGIVTTNNDDATENLTTTSVNTGLNDLRLGESGGDPQLNGLRVQNVTIPYGSTITTAYWTFRAATSESAATNLVIQGELQPNPVIYSATNSNISSRTTTTAFVNWNNVATWTGTNWYQSPDITPIVQELIDQSGWESGYSMAFMISGTGLRRADSRNKGATNAPILHIEYTPPCLPVPLIWLKADAGWTAGTWTDQSPYGRDGTNVGDPTKINDCLNFNPAIEYDGNDETYSSAPELIFMSGNHHINIFCVYEPTVAGTNLGVFGNQGNGGSNNVMLYKGIIGDGAGPLPDYPVPNMYGISPHLLSYTVDEEDNVTAAVNSTTAYNNGVLETSFTFNENNSGQIGNDMYVGSSGVHTNKQFFTGKISEFILYESSGGTLSLTETERLQIQSYLAVKYGFTLPLDYIDSQGNLIKGADDPFNEGIACIGRDDAFGLNQVKSRSKGEDVSVIISGDGFEDLEFVSMAHDAKREALVVDLFEGDEAYHCSERTWKLESGSGLNMVNIEIESGKEFRHILISTDPKFSDFEVIDLLHNSGLIPVDQKTYIKLANPVNLADLERS